MMRDPDLQRLLDATEAAFAARADNSPLVAALADRFFEATRAETGEPVEFAERQMLPTCDYLDAAMTRAAKASPETAAVVEAFARLLPRMTWKERLEGPNDPTDFAGSHANTSLIGMDGLEVRDDIRLGAGVIAPCIRYPDHDHPPEEIYLVLSDGEWRNAETEWHAPGIGGTFHNPPGIVHAMRSSTTPLFAIWCLVSVEN